MFALGHVVKGMLFDSTTVQIKAVKTRTALYLFLFIYLFIYLSVETQSLRNPVLPFSFNFYTN